MRIRIFAFIALVAGAAPAGAEFSGSTRRFEHRDMTSSTFQTRQMTHSFNTGERFSAPRHMDTTSSFENRTDSFRGTHDRFNEMKSLHQSAAPNMRMEFSAPSLEHRNFNVQN